MEIVVLLARGRIAIPKNVRDALGLSAGTKLTLEVRGHELVLSKEPAWRKIQGAGGRNLMAAFNGFKEQERERG